MVKGLNIKAVLAVLLLAVSVMPSAAQPTPAVSSAWSSFSGKQEECFERAFRAMQRNNYTRVERVGDSIFGDKPRSQIVIRCVTEKQMYYIFGGGPDARTLDVLINQLKKTLGD